MQGKKALLLSVLGLGCLTGCSSGDICVGFKMFSGEVLPWCLTAVKTKEVQNYNSTFEFYIGIYPLFCERWAKNVTAKYPDYKAAVSCDALNEPKGKKLSETVYYPIDSFPDETKWSYSTKKIRNGINEVTFENHVNISYSLEEAIQSGANRGIVSLSLVCLDENGSELSNQKYAELFDETCGFKSTEWLRFEKVNEGVKYSLYY